MKWAIAPSIIALLGSNFFFLSVYRELLPLTMFGFFVGTILFGLAWGAIGVHAESANASPRAAGTVEFMRVSLASAWIYVAFSVVLAHTPVDLRLAGLAAAYAIATTWWSMKLVGDDEHSSRDYALAAMVASAITAALISSFELPAEVCMPIVVAVIAARKQLRLAPHESSAG